MFAFWALLYVLAIVTTFGFGVAINMIFRRGWVSPVLYLLFTVYLMATAAGRMNIFEWILFIIGLIGAMLSGWAVKSLRQRGYSIFQR